MPLPSLGSDMPRVSLISTVYPWGAQAMVSQDHWDARAAVVDRPPVEFWRESGATPRRPNVILGGGITPRQGLRVGIAGARGQYADAAGGRSALDYSTVSAEGDFAFGYTRLSGEWVRSRFHAPGGTRAAEGWTAQAQQTLTPRLFLHSRTDHHPLAAGRQLAGHARRPAAVPVHRLHARLPAHPRDHRAHRAFGDARVRPPGHRPPGGRLGDLDAAVVVTGAAVTRA